MASWTGDQAHHPAVGVGLGPRNRIRESDRQAVLDAAALLQVRRSEAAAQAARGDVPGVEVVARGNADMNRWMFEASHEWRELLSVRPAATTQQLRVSLPNNRARVQAGLQMVSLFDHDGVEPDARVLLASESVGTYLFGVAPVQMKIVDRRRVLLQGPFVDGEPTIMAVSTAPCLDAAWRYWETAVASSFPAGDGQHRLGPLTARQHQIVALLANDLGDDAIAAALGVSVRTVRSDIAAVLDSLGVRSRFAAGVRLRLWAGTTD